MTVCLEICQNESCPTVESFAMLNNKKTELLAEKTFLTFILCKNNIPVKKIPIKHFFYTKLQPMQVGVTQKIQSSEWPK